MSGEQQDARKETEKLGVGQRDFSSVKLGCCIGMM